MGPVLYFRGARERRWCLSALVVTASTANPPPLFTEDGEVGPRPLAKCGQQTLWRYDFSLPLGRTPGDQRYAIGEKSWQVRVPPSRGDLRLAFTACNGNEQGNTWESGEKRNACWLDLAAEHARKPFHLLLQGGDQLYADTVWRDVPSLAEWQKEPWRKRRHRVFTPEMAETVNDYYFRRYCWLWTQPEVAPILAEVPSLMMWDDHDIFDGWGSYATRWEECAVFQGIYAAAREHFSLFQLAARPDDLPEGFSDRRGGQFGWSYRIGDVGILAPDLRSERTPSTVIGDDGWRALTAALDTMTGCSHILLISTVPLVNAHLTALERIFALVPGHQSWQDDLIDQWPSRAHWEEWQRVLRTLTDFSAESGASVTSLSGEIHLGALGLVERGGTQIYQLTSSGIVHPPPSAIATTALEWASTGTIRLAPDIAVKSLPITHGKRYLRTRNWLELDISDNRLDAIWHREEGDPVKHPSIAITTGSEQDAGSVRRPA